MTIPMAKRFKNRLIVPQTTVASAIIAETSMSVVLKELWVEVIMHERHDQTQKQQLLFQMATAKRISVRFL